MSKLPDRPFLTEDFSLRGGGIDFLGLRYVNLNMVGSLLIPELNNVTRDMGMFFLGAWIPWKFQSLCEGAQEYTEKQYRAFREKAEVAISLTMGDHNPAVEKWGAPRNRVGIGQNVELPSALSFKQAERNPQNSLYAAAIYGPALRALNLLASDRVEAEGKASLAIHLAAADSDTSTILQSVDSALRHADSYRKLASLEQAQFSKDDISKLGLSGLCPSCYRDAGFDEAKRSFRQKLLPDNPESPGYPRTRTARLLLETLRQRDGMSTADIRDSWYTGMFPHGNVLSFSGVELEQQRNYWSYFMARQYQRYTLELFLWCFEKALAEGCRSVEDVIDYWITRSGDDTWREKTLRGLLDEVAFEIKNNDEIQTSQSWNDTVFPGHEKFECMADPRDDKACNAGLFMIAGWYWRMLVRDQVPEYKSLMQFGGTDRVSMHWFLDWLRQRQQSTLWEFLKDVFSDLVFSQHMRVALSRFDGKAQRLRFALGDSGIEPTTSAKGDLGQRDLPWMPDRLDSLVELLSDVDVVRIDDDGNVYLGLKAEDVPIL